MKVDMFMADNERLRQEKVRLTRELSVKVVEKDWTKQLTDIRMRISEVEAKLYKKETVTEQLHTKTTVVTHVEDPRAAELRTQIEQVKADNSTLNQKITFHTNRMTQEDLYDVSLSGLRKNLQPGLGGSSMGKSPTTRPKGSSGLPGVTGGSKTETTVSSSKVTGNTQMAAGGNRTAGGNMTMTAGGNRTAGGNMTMTAGGQMTMTSGGNMTMASAGGKVVGGSSSYTQGNVQSSSRTETMVKSSQVTSSQMTSNSKAVGGMTVSGQAGSRVAGGMTVGGTSTASGNRVVGGQTMQSSNVRRA